MTGVIDQDKPKVSCYFCPAFDVAVDGPYLLGGAFPLGYSLPVQGVEVVEDACGIDYEIVLAVVDEDPDPAEGVDDVAGVTAHDVPLEGVVDVVGTRHKVNIIGNAQFSATIVQQCSKGEIIFSVLSEIVSAHPSPILIPRLIVICHKIEEGSRLPIPKYIRFCSLRRRCVGWLWSGTTCRCL